MLLESSARRYGDIFRMHLYGLGDLVVISDPALIKQVFTGNPDVYRAGEVSQLLRPIVGPNSLLLLDEPRHLRERKLILPPFHGDRMRQYESVMSRVAEEATERWPRDEALRLQPLMAEMTLDVIIQAVYGVEDTAEQGALREALRRMLDEGATRLAFQIPKLRRDFGPFRGWSELLALIHRVDEMIYAEVARRRVDPHLSRRADILSMLLQARREDGSGLTDIELRDELVTLLTAGHETTATALSWTLDLLMHHPEAAAHAKESAERDDDPYIDVVIREALRLRPVVPMVARRLAQPVQLGGHELEEGMVVAPCIFLTHRRPDLYPEPERFIPERFLGHSPETYAWLPFGGGTRRCLGSSFALFEMKVMLRTILRCVNFRPVNSRPEPIGRRSITFAPKRGARAIVSERRQASTSVRPS